MEFNLTPAFLTITALFGAVIFVGWLSARLSEYPILMTLRRWLRLAFFTLALTLFLEAILPDRDFRVLLAISLLLYVFAESMLYWIQISILNSADYDMFPRWREIETAWSAQKKHIQLKRKIESLEFKKSGSFVSEPADGVKIMLTCFDSADKTTRLSIAFLPYAGIYLSATNASSVLEDGGVLFTESSTAPFGLEYPTHYKVERHPLVGNPIKLLEIHQRRLSAYNPTEILQSPVEMLNTEIFDIKSASEESGFINPPSDVEEFGTLTSEGKYRVWLDTIMISYLPFLVR